MNSVRLLLPVVVALSLSFTSCSRRAVVDDEATAVQDRSKGGEVWGRNYFPNVPLTTHRGERVRFFDDLIKDKVVAVNFIYTKCSDSCPMETARMLEVQKLLGDRLGKDIFFYSISIDPSHDTPEVLKAYAENWKTGPGWTFLTGKEEDITLLRKKLGVYQADTKKKDHNLNLVIGNQKTGRWMKRSPAENPYILATQLGSWLHNWKLPGASDRDYANAPQVRHISTGEELFRARCSSCHSVGGGDHNDVEQRRVGPDLYNVTKQRDRAWLERWMMHPDEMLKEQDPIAMQLFAAYGNIIMPNMRLSKADADEILGYIDEESGVVERRAQRARGGDNVQAAFKPASGSDGVPASATQETIGALPDHALAPVREALAGYEAMRERLAADDLAGAQPHAATLAAALTKAAANAGASQKGLLALAESARAVGKPAEIDAARLAFGELSRGVVGLLVDNPALREGRFLFLCPMASGYKKWVQTSATLNNPYWGKRMLTCGSAQTSWAI